MSFDRAIERILGHEGGYSDSPADPGNWSGGRVGVGRLLGTKYGISAASYPHIDIKALTREDAKRIYKNDYWDRVRADEWPSPLDEAVFDMSINQGVSAAIKCLQRAAGVTADGVIGPNTRAAVKRADPEELLLRFFAWRAIGYAEIARSNPANWDAHKVGWMIRIFREHKEAVTR